MRLRTDNRFQISPLSRDGFAAWSNASRKAIPATVELRDLFVRSTALQYGMPTLTRRRSAHRQQCWHIYYGDVHVGTIAERVGNPHDTDRRNLRCPRG